MSTPQKQPTPAHSSTADQPRLLNLGCGPDYRAGWHNVDNARSVDADEHTDLNSDWPWPANTYRTILASHVIEHLDDPTHAMREAARVLAADGRLIVRVPIGRDAHTDPTHTHVWTYDTPTFYDHTNGPPWTPTLPLQLVDRELRVWFDGPLEHANGVLQALARRQPHLAEWAAVAGELTAVYEPQPP